MAPFIVDAQIVSEDTVSIGFRYEVENIGSTEAINVSEIGGDPYNRSLKPGQKIYLNKEVTLMRNRGDKMLPQTLIKDFDKQDYILEHMDTVFYFQEFSNKEFMSRFVYRIGKDKVKLIKYEVK